MEPGILTGGLAPRARADGRQIPLAIQGSLPHIRDLRGRWPFKHQNPVPPQGVERGGCRGMVTKAVLSTGGRPRDFEQNSRVPEGLTLSIGHHQKPD